MRSILSGRVQEKPTGQKVDRILRLEISLKPCFKNLRHKIFVLVQARKFLYRIMQNRLLHRFHIAAEGRVYPKNDFAFFEIRPKTHLFSKIRPTNQENRK